MLRTRLRKAYVRSVYISSAGAKLNHARHGRRDPKDEELAARQEVALLDQQLKELKEKQREFQVKLKAARDRELQQKLAERDNAKLVGEVSPHEIAALESQIRSPPTDGKLRGIEGKDLPRLPASINKLLPASAASAAGSVQLFSQPKTIRWQSIVSQLPQLPIDTPVKEVEQFMVAIPLKQRAQLIGRLESIVPPALQSQFVKDQLMAGYAELGRAADVQRILTSCESPSTYSFGHWAKSLFKTGAPPEDVFAVVKSMKEKGLEPSLPVMSNAIQSLIQYGRHKEAEAVFDNMKYWSVETQPDRKLYNSMILSSAKQHNVNRCLDLLTEMKERRPYPVLPDQETYNYIIYACARDKKTQLMAWELFLEARDLGYETNLQSFRALLYLCGSSGELLLARALIRNLSEVSPEFIDDYALNCLFLAYREWQPGPSKILASPSGQRIRANILMNADKGTLAQSPIPLLPMSQLDAELILLESNAIVEYYAENSPHRLVVDNPASRATSPTIHNFLRIAINVGEDISEFKRRFARFTKFVGEEESNLLPPEATDTEQTQEHATSSATSHLSHERHPTFTVRRDQYLYRLAIQAAIKFRDLEFAREIWTERGQWRRLDDFRKLSQEQRNRFDFQFARDLVELLAVCGRIEEALLLVKSTKSLRKWKRYHLTALIAECERLEDIQSINQITKIIKSTTASEDDA